MKTMKSKSVNMVSIITVSLVLFQRLAVNMFGFEFSLALFILPIFLLYYCYQKKAKINTNRVFLFAAIVFLLLISTFINDVFSNIPSLLLFIGIYFFFCWDMKFGIEEKNEILKYLRVILFLSAIIAILQFISQLIGLPYYDLFDIFPKQIKLSGFNTYYSISYGSKIMKSNGWIYLEPSFLSQFMALGIVLELDSIHNKKLNRDNLIHIVTYSLALIFSFSGTGIVLLVVCLVPLLRSISLKNKCIVILGLLLGVFIFSQTEYFHAISDRIFEFQASNSSGAIRFINPYIVSFGNDNFFFGNGAGAADRIQYDLVVNHNAITKVMIEYGFVCLCLFVSFVILSFCKKGISTFTVCLLIMYFFLSGNLLQPSITFLLFFIKEIDSKKTRGA